jgi:DNA-directed RNA polymerase sigma subunit (sigma70/sigma32)
MNMTRERARQVEARSLAKLRHPRQAPFPARRSYLT